MVRNNIKLEKVERKVITMYYATLQLKQGERRALKKLEEFGNNVSRFVPNLIINDASQETLDLIRQSYTNFVLLDVRHLDSDDVELLEELIQKPENSSFDILYPIDYLLNSPQHQLNYVRINRNVVNPFFTLWLEKNHKNLPNSIMLDFEYIEGTNQELISHFFPIIKLLQEKEIIIMSGAVPNRIPVSSEQNYQFRRIEKDLYNEIKKIAPSNSKLIFGDYTSVSPILTMGGMAIVQIKYTLEDDYWFVRNGLRRGDYDFVAVCKQIVNLDNFDEEYCWGDYYIKSVVEDNTNKGNPSVWTSIGVNRHIAVCLNESL